MEYKLCVICGRRTLDKDGICPNCSHDDKLKMANELATLRAERDKLEAQAGEMRVVIEKAIAQLKADCPSGSLPADDPHYTLYWDLKNALASTTASTLVELRKAAILRADAMDEMARAYMQLAGSHILQRERFKKYAEECAEKFKAADTAFVAIVEAMRSDHAGKEQP